MKNVAILGAGFGGLSAAFDLIHQGNKVTIYEASTNVGGLAAGFKESHWEWSVEKYYHHWFASDRHMLGLINELGWSDKVIYSRPYTVMYHGGRFYPFDSILKAILFPGLGWGINKIRFGLVGLFLRLSNDWNSLEQYTVNSWMRKWAGDRVYELMWEPLMIGKFGDRYATQVNMAWMWARLKARTTHLGTFKGGFQAFADLFSATLQKSGVDLKLSSPIHQILPTSKGGIELVTNSGTIHYDQCLVTTSPNLLAQLAPSLPPEYLKGLLELKSMGAVVMTLSLKYQLSEQGYYWYNLPKSAGFPFLALVEHTNFVSPEYFGGDHLVYCGDYLQEDHEYFQLNQDELLNRFMPAFIRFNPRFEPGWINKIWLYRTNYAQPVPLLHHARNIPPIQTPIPGLYFASMSQVYPWDRGTNFAVEIGRRAARLMMEHST